MFTLTGLLLSAYEEPAALPNPETGELELGTQLNINVKATADEKQYGFTMPINEKTPALSRLNEWLDGAVEVTVFCSSARALPFLHDKDEKGNPKVYANRGRKVPIKGAKNTVVAEAEIDAFVALQAFDIQPSGQANLAEAEIDAFVALQAFDIQPSGQANLAEVAKIAHGDFLRQRAQARKRSEQDKKAKAEARALKRIEDEKQRRAQQAQQKKSA